MFRVLYGMHRVLRPKIFLVYKHSNWSMEFNSTDKLLAYLKEHNFDRTRLREYLVFCGEGIWCQIAADLPVGTTTPAVIEEQSPF